MQQLWLVFADLVDSTALTQQLGEERAAQLWADHDHRARRLLAAHRGREVDRSDGFFLIFRHDADALRFAAAYHRMLADLGLAARVGVHHAAVRLRKNPPEDVQRGAKPLEVDSLAKPLAARIMALAEAGNTLLSAAAAERIDAAALEGQVLHRLGHYRLKGIDEPVAIAAVAAPGAACPPPPDSDKAYRVVFDEGLWRPLRQVPHNLAPERDAFIGREAELRELADRLDGGARLLTVLGPGGMGKTRLVRRYARAWLGDWPGGVAFCDLSEARTPEGIHCAVSLALGVTLGKADPALQLGHAIAGRGRCLMIMDNFEQVQGHAEATVGRWLDRAPTARFVVTSRERLQLAGEQVLALEPLAPGGDALRLFEVRARAQQPGFAIDDGNRATVVQIVRLLDGLPLALELAAARAGMLSPAQLLARMKDRFALLAGARGPAARQATLEAAIDWSWELLTPWEQAALAQCSVFEGGFRLEAAEAVIDLGPWREAPPALDVVQSLVHKSLLRAWWPHPAAPRLDITEPFFGMYLSIHEYASRKRHAMGEQASRDAERRHGRHFAAFGSDEAVRALSTHGGLQRRALLAMELDNLLCACRRALGGGEAQTAAACFLAAWALLEAQGPYTLAAELGAHVAARADLSAHQRVRVEMATSFALRTAGRPSESDALLARALDAARQAGDRRGEAMTLRLTAMAAHHNGHIDEAERLFQQALALEEQLGDRAQHAILLANMATLRMEQGRMADARGLYDTALALYREVGNRAAEGISLGNLATLLHELGQLDEARVAYDGALAIHREAGSRLQEATTLCNLGILLKEQRLPQQAAAHYTAALKIQREVGNRRGEGVVLHQLADLHQVQGELQQARGCYEEALRIHREVGNVRFEAGLLAGLGVLLATQGEVQAGLRALDDGERALRGLGDLLDLAKLLCAKGKLAAAHGAVEQARSALAEAQALATQLGAGPQSELGQQIAALERTLG